MKNLSIVIVTLLLFSCTANISNFDSTKTSNMVNFDSTKISSNIQSLEISLKNQGTNGVATDVYGNTYIVSIYGKIFKINSSNNVLESKDNSISVDNLGSQPNLFFHIDSKGNGYLIPIAATIDSISQDPVTKKFKTSTNKFTIYKISDLKITEKHLISIEDFRFKTYCPSPDDCSDMYLNVGSKNYSLNEFLKSKKEFIENEDISLDIFGQKEFLNSSGNGFYLKEDERAATLYSFINGISKKTDISLNIGSERYLFDCNIDHLGNGHIIYNHEGKSKYHQINNYIIGVDKQLSIQKDDQLYKSIYSIINNNGTGLNVYSSEFFYKLRDFKVTDKESLSNVNTFTTERKLINIGSSGNGYMVFNNFLGVDSSGLSSKFNSEIFAVRNYNLIK